jgi:hypothetical protein
MTMGGGGTKADDVGGNRVTAYANWVIKWRWLVIVVSLMAAMAVASGGQFLGFSTNYRVFFSAENPQLQAFETMQRIYIRDDNISIVIHPVEGEVFTPELLSSIREMTDRKCSLLKTLLFKDYRQYLGQFWRSHTFDMVNAQTGKSTILKFTDYAFKVGLSEKDFRKGRLKRAR